MISSFQSGDWAILLSIASPPEAPAAEGEHRPDADHERGADADQRARQHASFHALRRSGQSVDFWLVLEQVEGAEAAEDLLVAVEIGVRTALGLQLRDAGVRPVPEIV